MTRYTVHFSGNVQGVGFRYTTVRIAENYEVAGYVQNLEDGRVRLVAEGRKMQLDGLVNHILSQMDRYIKSHTVDEAEPTGEFGGRFQIRH